MNPTPNETPWYSKGLCFGCTQCGNCCSGAPGYVWVTLDEIKEIEDYLKKQSISLGPYLRRSKGQFSLVEKSNGDCLFLQRLENGKAICQIHPVKPSQCRKWPFWNTILKTKNDWEKQTTDCPGMNKGKLYSFEEIEKVRLEEKDG